MDKEELKKTICLNLRSITQSFKGGVPVHCLQSDYKCLIGTDIPLQELGYNSLSTFLEDIPDTITLKRNKEGLIIAEAVPDATTAHIAKLISKQKGPKVPKTKSRGAFATKKKNLQEDASSKTVRKKSQTGTTKKKKSALLTAMCSASRCPQSNNNHTNHPDTSQDIFNQKQIVPGADKENLKKSVMINLRCVTLSSKVGVPLKNLQRDYQDLIGTPIPFETLGHSSLESFLHSIPDVISLKKKNEQLVAEGVPDVTTAHIANLISRQKASKRLSQKYVPMHASKKVEPSSKKRASLISKPSISKEPLKEKLPVKTPVAPRNSTNSILNNMGLEQRILKNSEMNIPAFTKNVGFIVGQDSSTKDITTAPTENRKSLEYFPCIVDNIRKAMFSSLLGLHNLLFGFPYMDCLQDKILTFTGYLFHEGSENWKKQEFLLSVLPLNGLKEYLDLLCIKYDNKEEKHALLNKLMRFLSVPNAELLNAERKIDRKLSDRDFYQECQEKDRLISEVVEENYALKDELLKMKRDCKNDVQLTLEVDNLQNEMKKLKIELDITKANLKKARIEKRKLGQTISSLQGNITQARKEKKVISQALTKQTSEMRQMGLLVGSVIQTNITQPHSKKGSGSSGASSVTNASTSKS